LLALNGFNSLKSFIFSTENDRGGVMLCDIDNLPDAVEYLNERFPGIVRIEAGKELWTREQGLVAVEKPADPPS